MGGRAAGPGRKASLGVMFLTVILGLSSCSDDSNGSDPDNASTASAEPSSGVSPSGGSSDLAAMTPAWQQVANFNTTAGKPRAALIKVYPLQRIDGRLLLTVDIVAQGAAGTKLAGLNYLCSCAQGGDFRDVSLVDTTDRVRYGPLRAGSITGKPYSSNINLLFHDVGTTYRVGGFFPDPGSGITSMGVDLQQGGIAPAVPIVDGGQPAPDLVQGGSSGGGTTTPGPAASVAAPTGGDGNGPLVTWTTSAPGSDAFEEKHNLIAKVVGGTVNEAGGKEGIVTLNADVLFAFNSAKLSSKAGDLVNQARSILTGKADPAKPVDVIGYTDNKGSSTYNQTLSEQRADAVAKGLRSGDLGSIELRVSGRGEEDAVAPNAKPGGADNPRGRALNRRVEITYTPKPAPISTTAPPTAPAATPGSSASVSPAITLPPATVKSNGVNPETMAAAVRPIIKDGTLSLVSVEITAEQDTLLIDAFTGRSRASRDIGAFTIVDPATKRVYLAAYDKDERERVMGTYTHRMTGGVPMHFAFYTAALPDNLTTATVDLDQLGAAKNVPATQ